MSQPSELPEAIAITPIAPIATKPTDTTNVNSRIGSETLYFSMFRIVGLRAWKSNGVSEF